MNIYLDIDGVLFSDEFIEYVETNYPNSTYWLTTHCWQKENNTIPLLSRFFGEETMVYIRKIIPTEWNMLMTEAIVFTMPFLWFEDGIMASEQKALEAHNALDSYIEVDLRKNPQYGIYLHG